MLEHWIFLKVLKQSKNKFRVKSSHYKECFRYKTLFFIFRLAEIKITSKIAHLFRQQVETVSQTGLGRVLILPYFRSKFASF